MMNNVQILLAMCAVFLIMRIRKRRGIPLPDLILIILLCCLASIIYDEALKLPVSARPKEGSQRFRYTDFNTERRKQHFYRRFRFRHEHFEEFMIAIDLLDADTCEFKRIKLDCHRHYVHADTAMLIFLGRLASPSVYINMMDEFGMDEKQLSASFNWTARFFYHSYALPLSKIEIWEPYFDIFAEKMETYGSPFSNLIGIVDGNFMSCSLPGGELDLDYGPTQDLQWQTEGPWLKVLSCYLPEWICVIVLSLGLSFLSIGLLAQSIGLLCEERTDSRLLKSLSMFSQLYLVDSTCQCRPAYQVQAFRVNRLQCRCSMVHCCPAMTMKMSRK